LQSRASLFFGLQILLISCSGRASLQSRTAYSGYFSIKILHSFSKTDKCFCTIDQSNSIRNGIIAMYNSIADINDFLRI